MLASGLVTLLSSCSDDQKLRGEVSHLQNRVESLEYRAKYDAIQQRISELERDGIAQGERREYNYLVNKLCFVPSIEVVNASEGW